MSAITIENDLVHYEVLGRGRPVILIHGWLGSWRYWIPTMQQLSLKYRIYALDLWGFGDTQKDTKRYGFKSQVTLLYEFMDKMGIAKAALVGHALGAAIAIDFARTHPERAPRVMLVSPPLFNNLTVWNESAVKTAIKEATREQSESASINATNTLSTVPVTLPTPVPAELQAAITADMIRRNPFLDHPERLAMLGMTTPSAAPVAAQTAPPAPLPPKMEVPNPLLALLNNIKPNALLERHLSRNDENFEKLRAEVAKMDESVLTESARSFSGLDMAFELHQLTNPALLLHGKDDPFLGAPDDDFLAKIAHNKEPGQFLPFVIPEFRHFPMLESAVKFNRLLMDFLDTPDLSNVQLRETWRRQLR